MRERKTVRTYTGDSKYFPVVMESFECSVECVKRGIGEHALASDIAEIEERAESLGDFGRHITFKCIYEDLVDSVCKVVTEKNQSLPSSMLSSHSQSTA